MSSSAQQESVSAEQQDGAVAIIAAVVIAFVAIILLAFSTDIGSLWQSQRALVTDTDAAALAGAIELAEDWMATDVCSEELATSEAERVLGLNNLADTVEDVSAECRIDGDAFIGQVQMTARQPSPGFVSRRDLSAVGTSTATFELLLGEAEGLAVCQNLFSSTGEPNANFVMSRNGTDYLLFPYKFAEQTLDNNNWGPQCTVDPPITGSPNTAGGWGWLDGPCDLDEDLWCDAEVGTDNLKKSLTDRVGEEIDFPIYEQAQGVGSGAEYRIVGRVTATLVGACETGNGPFLPEDCGPNAAGNWSKLQGQPGFVVVTEPVATFFVQNTAKKFRDARYSICDVDGSGDYCP